MPKNLGSCIDELYALREARLKLQRSAEELGEKEAKLHEYILNTFSKTDLEGG